MNHPAILRVCSVVFLCLAFRQPLESHAVSHILVQLPLLAWCGWEIVNTTSAGQSLKTRSWNQDGVAPLLVALFFIFFWMLPKSIDAALTNSSMEVFKFITLPIGVGSALALGWCRAHPILKGFLKANAISMLVVLAFLYTHAPVRICNAYLIVDQEQLGYGFLLAAIGLAILWTVPLISPLQTRRVSHQRHSREQIWDAK